MCVYEIFVGFRIYKFKEDNILVYEINIFVFLVIFDFSFLLFLIFLISVKFV